MLETVCIAFISPVCVFNDLNKAEWKYLCSLQSAHMLKLSIPNLNTVVYSVIIHAMESRIKIYHVFGISLLLGDTFCRLHVHLEFLFAFHDKLLDYPSNIK